MEKDRKILVSGVKPTGRPHIGNYFGAMRQFVTLQDEYQSYIFIADLHALNQIKDAGVLRDNTVDLILDYLATGLDPQKVTFFKQSDVLAHTQLCWIFNTLTTMPYLMRAHAYKDATAKGEEINVGTFDYPMLMAADILLYDTDVVPVGRDQKQHIEFARDTAEKFNTTYGNTFKLPEALIIEEVETVPGTDGRKMSKSYNNTIGLFATDEEIEKAVMSIPTDSKGVDDSKDPNDSHLYAIHKLLLDDVAREKLSQSYKNGGTGYKTLKEMLIDDLKKFIGPLRERREELEKNKEVALDMLTLGARVANEKASKTLSDVQQKIGLTF